MTLDEFHNGLRILIGIDRDELESVGITSVVEWEKFRIDPYRYFIRTDDEKAEKIWSIAEQRMKS